MWYLSFDCATKTFGYIFVKILTLDTDRLKQLVTYIYDNRADHTRHTEFIDLLQNINDKLTNTIQIEFADCVDLCPGIPDKKITRVQRTKCAAAYIKKHIMPLVENLPKDQIEIFIEYQMNINKKSDIIVIVLLTLFSDYTCKIINPGLKNKIRIVPEGDYSHFIKKYKTNYYANKKHALFNFKQFELLFKQNVAITDKKKGHIADAFMQIIGKLAIG